MPEILTLNARSYILFECIQDQFGLSTSQMRKEITSLYSETVAVLKTKGIEYSELKSALVPKTDKYEAAFIFDSRRIESGFYGRSVFKAFMPFLDKTTTQSVRVGDCLGSEQQLIRNILESSIVSCRDLNYEYSSNFYCIYINNLSKSRISIIHDGLSQFCGYCGHIPTTKEVAARIYFSTTLMSFFLKKKNIIITSHESDRLDHENVNLGGYPFEQFEYQHLSIREDYFEIFLHYKIERPKLDGSDFDSRMALSSISNTYIPIESCKLIIEENKYKYLFEKKFGSLKRSGLDEGGIEDLKRKVREKINSNYIYNMNYLENHDVIKFNIVLEFLSKDHEYPVRLNASFEFNPQERTIRLITLY